MNAGAEVSHAQPFLNSTLLPMLLLSLARQKNTPTRAKTVKTEYDYIIVGAGSAGSVLASRLSELPCATVLLLEAGKSPPILTEVPSFRRFYLSSDIDWQYKTVPQRHTGDGLINKAVVWPSGKAVGGSSLFSRDILDPGNREDFDKWADEGAEGWSYEEMLPYFRKLEDCEGKEESKNDFLQFSGRLSPEVNRKSRSDFEDVIAKTAQFFGYEISNPSSDQQTGRYSSGGGLTNNLGQACSAAKAYLVTAENRSNLDILPNAMARKVLIKNRKAVGVQFDFRGTTYEVKAKREVILSSGTINTAQLLMLSGVGPRHQLEKYKIPVLADLPVGTNLQDHVGAFLSFHLNPSELTLTDKIIDADNIEEYIQNRAGPLASSHVVQAIPPPKKNAFFSETDTPNHRLHFVEAQPEIIQNEVGLKPEVFENVFASSRDRPLYLCVSSVLHPSSRGTVTLNSDDPYDAPSIDPRYLEDNEDVQDIVEGLKNCMRIGAHANMQKVGSYPLEAPIPGCEKYEAIQDLYLECVAKSIPVSLYHPVGTARMGSPDDPRTVVDPQLRVLHIKNLRVVDASVMPAIPSGGTYLPTLVLAEKAADIIKSTADCNRKHGDTPSKDTSLLSKEHTIQQNPSFIQELENAATVKTDFGDFPAGAVKDLDYPYALHDTESKSFRQKPEHFATVKKDLGDFSPETTKDLNYPHPLRNTESKRSRKTSKIVLKNNGNRKKTSKKETNSTKSNDILINVTPWNKEVPFVIPWNQELLQLVIFNDTRALVSNITNILANIVPGNQGSPQPNFPMNSSSQSTNSLINQNAGLQNLTLLQRPGSSSQLLTPISNSPQLQAPISSTPQLQIPLSLPKFQGNLSFQTPKFHKSIQFSGFQNLAQLQRPEFTTLQLQAPIGNTPQLQAAISNAPQLQIPLGLPKFQKTFSIQTPMFNKSIQFSGFQNLAPLQRPGSSSQLLTPISNSPQLQAPISNIQQIQAPISNSGQLQNSLGLPKFQKNFSLQTPNFNKSISVQINKSPELQLANKIREVKSKIQTTLVQLSNSNSGNIQAPSNRPMNTEMLINPPSNTRLNATILEYLTKLKKLKKGDQSLCNYLLNNMKCQVLQCQKLKNISGYLFNTLCKS